MSDVKFLIGADPELFVRDPDGNLVSAFGMIPGTKDNPFKVEHGAVQVDGMALEFNIDPAATAKQFERNITAVLAQLKDMIPAGYQFDFSPVAEFGKEYIDAQPDEAKLLGCTPDFSATTGSVNPSPKGDYGFRTASGHIHIGWTEGQDIDVPEHREACIMAVKQLDITLGVAQRLWDKDIVRSKMYGKFGAFRPKHYGVEYRTLSNTWVNDANRRELVFNTAMVAMEQLMQGNRIYDHWYMGEFDDDVARGVFGNILYAANRTVPNLSRSVRRIYDVVRAEATAQMAPPNQVLPGLQVIEWNPFINFAGDDNENEDEDIQDDFNEDIDFNEDEDEGPVAVGF